MVSVCLPSDALSQQLPSYLDFSNLGWRVSPHRHPSWPWTWSSSSWPSCAHSATAPWTCIPFGSVQFSRSVVSDSLWPHESAARQSSLSITNSRSSLRLTSIESVMPSSHLILCHPLLLLPPICPSIRAFSNESTLHMKWPKYWSFSFSIIPSKEIPGLLSTIKYTHLNELKYDEFWQICKPA